MNATAGSAACTEANVSVAYHPFPQRSNYYEPSCVIGVH